MGFNRRSIRLPDYDYSQPGGYFITIVTQRRVCLFGEIVDGEMRLNKMGRIVHYEWDRLRIQFPGVTLDAFVVMPNHLHGIIILTHPVGATRPELGKEVGTNISCGRSTPSGNPGWVAPTRNAHGPMPGSLGAIIARYKSRVTKRIQAITPESSVWQRNYYEHVLRNNGKLARARAYIINNPGQWIMDEDHPSASFR